MKTKTPKANLTATRKEIDRQLEEVAEVDGTEWTNGIQMFLRLVNRAGWNVRFSCVYEDGAAVDDSKHDGLYYPEALRPTAALKAVYGDNDGYPYMKDLVIDMPIEEYHAFFDVIAAQARKDGFEIISTARENINAWGWFRSFLPLPKATDPEEASDEVWDMFEALGCEHYHKKSVSGAYDSADGLLLYLSRFVDEGEFAELEGWLRARPELTRAMFDAGTKRMYTVFWPMYQFLGRILGETVPDERPQRPRDSTVKRRYY